MLRLRGFPFVNAVSRFRVDPELVFILAIAFAQPRSENDDHSWRKYARAVNNYLSQYPKNDAMYPFVLNLYSNLQKQTCDQESFITAAKLCTGKS